MTGGTSLEPGSKIAHFRVKHLLGAGGMGVVYLARDTRLGRRVALKLIHPERFAEEESVQAFVEEMRITARLNHPNVVQLYDVGRHEGMPWAALEYLEGRTLREQLSQERLSVGAALRIGLAIASALEAAAAAGVLHLDLKPENVLLPPDGRPRVVDFGLSRSASAGDMGLSGGTPGYMAPEQWLRQPLGPATDLWALGIILFECLAGVHPFQELGQTAHSAVYRERALSGEAPPLPNAELLPPELGHLVRRCLSASPEQRPTAATATRTLDRLLSGRPALGEDEPPFRGLMPFLEPHARYFFGRDEEIALLAEQLRGAAVLPVLGLSGAGKSSLVMAGLLPRLREDAYWIALQLRPGRHPLAALSAALQVKEGSSTHRSLTQASNHTFTASLLFDEAFPVPEPPPAARTAAPLDPKDTAERLRGAPELLSVFLAELAERHRCRILLFVDQLEEAFTLCEDPEERDAFLTAMMSGADGLNEPVRVIYTIRDDFLGKLAAHSGAHRALKQVFVVRPPDTRALLTTLVRPLELAGYRFEDPALPAEMADAVRGSPAALPLLQFTARALWERRDPERRVLTWAAYRELGGVAGALAHHADGVLSGLTGAQLQAARQVLLRAVTSEGTRRVLEWDEAVDGLPAVAGEVLERLVDARLVISSGESPRMVELAHESLTHQWRQLASWIETSREDLHLLAEVEDAARKWERLGRRPSDCWQGDALRDALQLTGHTDIGLSLVGQRFVEASAQKRDRFLRGRRIVQAGVLGGLTLVTVASVVAAASFSRLRDEAELAAEASRVAQASTLAASARLRALSGDPLLARQELRASLALADTLTARSLWWELSHQPVSWTLDTPGPYNAAWCPRCGRLFTVEMEGRVRSWDPATREWTRLNGSGELDLVAVAVSDDSGALGVIDEEGAYWFWDLTDLAAPPRRGPTAPPGTYWHLYTRFLPDGTLLSFRTDDLGYGELLLQRGDEVQTRRLGHHFSRVVVDEAGEWLFAASYETGEVVAIPLAGGEARTVGSFEPQGGELLLTLSGGRLIAGAHDLKVWDLGRAEEGAVTLENPRVLPGYGELLGVGAAVGEDRLAVVDQGGTLHLWDLLGGSRLWSLPLVHEPPQRLATWDAQLFLMSENHIVLVDTSRAPPDTRGHEDYVDLSELSPDGTVLFTSSPDRRVIATDTATGIARWSAVRAQDRPYGLAISPDGEALSVSCQSETLIWDPRSRRELTILPEKDTGMGAAWSPRHKGRLYQGLWSGNLRTWDLRDRDGAPADDPRAYPKEPFSSELFDVAVSDDGAEIAVGGHMGLLALSEDGSGQWRELTGHTDAVTHLDWERDRLVSCSYDRTVRVWDTRSGDELQRVEGASSLGDADLSEDGARLAWLSSAGVEVMDLEGPWRATLRDEDLTHAQLNGDGSTLFTGNKHGNLMRWELPSLRPAWRSLGQGEGVHLTHLGVSPPDASWPPEVLEGGWRGDLRGDTWCVQVGPDAVERRAGGDHHLAASGALTGTQQVVAADGWCAVRTERGELYLLTDRLAQVAAGVEHLQAADEGVVAVSAEALTLFGPAGEVRATLARPPESTTGVPSAGGWTLGFEDGHIELLGPQGGALLATAPDRHPVKLIARREGGMIGVALHSGWVELWDPDEALPLARDKLQGEPVHLSFGAQALIAGTAAGDGSALPLWPFIAPYDTFRDAVGCGAGVPPSRSSGNDPPR
ncbi:MAG: protein kinase [Deltaproteobacteria bacterium]|nr:protein kinase [Deltaproteobacteria bacterium]